MTTVTSAQANKLYQVALFTAANRNRSMVNILTEQQEAPKAVSPDKKSTKQTSAGAPVVRITDLNKQAGDEVTFSIMHKLSKRPTMGDERVEGRGEDLSHADFSLKINQGRHLVDAGGRMSQQRTKFNLASSARTLLGTYFNDLQDQCAIVHLAGARGDFVADDTILPTAEHPEFKKIMINDVLPPTHDRHFFGGDATSFESIDQSDLFTLALVDNLSLFIDEMAHPLQPVRLSGDELSPVPAEEKVKAVEQEMAVPDSPSELGNTASVGTGDNFERLLGASHSEAEAIMRGMTNAEIDALLEKLG